MPSTNSTERVLRAVYSAPQPSTQAFEHRLSAPLASSETSPEHTKLKVAYLAELRSLVPKLQNEINVFLTERMEDDKKAAEAQGRQLSEKEAKEEENYGEEVVEEDA
ncbi:uncharacterized protein ACLA_007470 [Aspergillus clavatus NRRL 1]|uniref:EKC/KEOPS complex subunit GON7 n=1 Tax=Aspergillus clavatus (strain ATCC 1007 / CBS 513.65 / DSM 816 / NCTC 3887 / NRRL 1 / QM 1276 / 107) TaxID=344612 RepID=A1CDR1_ASPCL|nr:uncharacterized protein ACLA_007470 [Aspergillus clavatus NRRL 1]EAW11988.1 conserved hypothetical protein [Aspergillus clavatus NRRL 1]